MRLAGWNERLTAFALAALGRRFCWGETDCALLGFEAFDAMTGGHLAVAYRGRYDSLHKALRFQRRWWIDAAHVLRESGCVEVKDIERGDIVVVPRDGFACCHVAFGARVLAAWCGTPVGWGSTAEALAAPGASILRVP